MKNEENYLYTNIILCRSLASFVNSYFKAFYS